MRNYFTFGGVDCRTYGVFITGTGTYNAPERDYETIAVPGRDGAVLGAEKRLQNIELVYPAFISSSFKTNVAGFKAAMLSKIGYQRLTDTYHPDEFRMAFYKGGMEVEARTQHDAGEFDVEFECKPQRYLTSGESVTTLTAAGTISNPTSFDARPLIKVTGYGALTVNSDVITIASSSNTFCVIDSELMDCYKNTVNMNGLVTFSTNDFPVLVPGSNSISFANTITKVEITPRWWRV